MVVMRTMVVVVRPVMRLLLLLLIHRVTVFCCLCPVLGISLRSPSPDPSQDDNDRVCGRQHVFHDGAGGDGQPQSAHLLWLRQWSGGQCLLSVTLIA